MDPQPALLDEIRARPDDDGPRLVFADLLSERGDPWGELIVAGCEVARLAREGVVDAERRRGLARRCRAIHQERWRERSLTFKSRLDRGFCASVDVARDEVKQVEGYEFAALREVRLRVSTVGLGALADWPLLRHVDRLVLRGADGDHHPPSSLRWAEDHSVRTGALGQIAQRMRSSSVELDHTNLDGEELYYLATSALRESVKRYAVVGGSRNAAEVDWPALEALELVALQFTGADIERTLRRPELASLVALDVSRNAFGDSGMRAIVDRAPPNLRALRMMNTELDAIALTALARSSLVRRLEVLAVGEDRADPTARALSAIAEAAGQLVELVVDQRSLNEAGAAEIVRRLRAPLRKLRLRGGEHGLSIVTALVNNAALRGLRWLDLSGQPIVPAAAAVLARADLPALEWLDLSDCRLRRESVFALACSPTLPRRVALRLHDNGPGPESVSGPLLARFHDVRF